MPSFSAERRYSAGTASASRGSPSWASDAATSPCTIGSGLCSRTASAATRSANTSSSPARIAVHRLAEHRLAARRRLAERAHDAGDALVVRAGDAAPVVGLARRHVQLCQELVEVHCAASVKHAVRRDGSSPGVRINQQRAHPPLRRRAARRPPERQGRPRARDAGGAVHAARAGRARARRGGELRPPQARARRWPARRRCFAALDRRRAVSPRSCSTAAGSTARWPPATQRDPLRLSAHRHVRRSATRTRRSSSGARPARRSSRPRTRRARRSPSRSSRRVRLPVRGPRRPRPGDRARPPPGRGRRRADAGRHDRRRRARAGARAGAAGAGGRHARRPAPAQHAQHRLRQRAAPGSSTARRSSTPRVGGLGGCPFAPRATGNIATEDLVYLLDGEGVETGVDLDALIGVAEWLSGVLGRELPGLLQRAGNFP